MVVRNSTTLDSLRLERTIRHYCAPWRCDALSVQVRYSRAAPFSGTCYYLHDRIFVNLGRSVRYPYRFATNLARARATGRGWRREALFLSAPDGFGLVLFVFLHELFHYLVKQAGRAPGRKEGMCDRFAAGKLVDDFGWRVMRGDGRSVPRGEWDFRDLEAFVAGARRPLSAPAAIPVRIAGCGREPAAWLAGGAG